MTWLTGIILYLLIWWLTLFAVLPWGIRYEGNPDPAQESPGAPANPNLMKKFLATTVVSAIVWAGVYFVVESNVIDFRAASMKMMEEDLVK